MNVNGDSGQGGGARLFDGAVFTISLDFELMWGSFDSGKHRKFVSHLARDGAGGFRQTRAIVDGLLALFRRYDVSVTWATVGHLFLDACEESGGVKHADMPRPSHAWFGRDWYEFDPCRNLRAEPLWYGRDMVEKILAAEPKHDVGSHSFSHVIFGDAGCTREVAEAEVRKCVELARAMGLKLESFVFPRNRLGHLDVLREHGFTVTRGAAPFWFAKFKSRTLRRVGHVVDDVLAVTPDCGLPVRSEEGLWVAPVSMFLQSMDGPRRLIPTGSRIRKGVRGIERAVREKSVFHLSFHPTENFCYRTREMFRALEAIVAHAARRRDEGLLQVMTMADIAAHCERRAWEAGQYPRGSGGLCGETAPATAGGTDLPRPCQTANRRSLIHTNVNAPLKVLHVSTVDLGISFLLPQLRALQADGFEVHAACADGPLVPSFEREGIKVHRVEVTRDLTPLADLKLLGRLFRIMRRERYAVVHAHTPKIELVGQLAARLARVPVIIYTNHGLIFLGRTGALEGRVFRTAARVAGLFSDKVISQSAEDVSTVVRERIYPRRKVGFLGNGIDISLLRAERFTPEQVLAKRRELGIPDGDRVVGMVGRYVWEKGYREFFEAARLILEEGERVSFVTVGVPLDSERDPVDFSLLRELGVGGKFFVLKSRGDMPELYSVMDVVALPSYREGFPRSLMEASAMSRPVVASDVSGCRQAVAEGENGFLVPVKDAAALASKIKLLLGDPALASRMGARGREIAEERFDVERVVERLRGFYDELLKRKLPGYERAGLRVGGVESYDG